MPVETSLGPVNPRVFTAVRIDQLLRGEPIGHGSGFLVSSPDGATDRAFLVSCYHVVTGRQPLNPSMLLEGLPDSPDELQFRLFRKDSPSALPYSAAGTVPTDRFREHRRRSEGIDLASLGVEFSEKHQLHPVSIDEVAEARTGIAGSDAFVAGFPFDELTDKIAPIWKRASIATEPTMEEHGAGRFLIDSVSTSGMSGAPIFQPRDVDEVLIERTGSVPSAAEAAGSRSAAFKRFQSMKPVGTQRVRYFDFAGVYVGRKLEPGIGLTLGIGLTPTMVRELLVDGLDVDHPYPTLRLDE